MQGNVLYSHMCRGNPYWREMGGQRVLVVFQELHSYISQTWYNTESAVPAWKVVPSERIT
ncbi:TPA: FMN-binding negative transcriptional regulator [Salmonella enterica subsp. enterica serovar Bovismorbificans]